MEKISDNRFQVLADKAISWGGYIAFLLIAIVFAAINPKFLAYNNLMNILLQSSVLGIVSLGMTVILIGGGTHVIKGGIDLSLANNLAIGATITAMMIRAGYPFLPSFLLSFIISLIFGLINAFAVVKLKVAPLLGTLCMMYILDGANTILSNNTTISVTNDVFQFIASYKLFGVIPFIAIVFIVLFGILTFVCDYSAFGNRLSACGGNAQAAAAAGINVEKMVVFTYILAAACASIAGLMSNARISGSTTGLGSTMFLDIMLISYMSAIFSKRAIPNLKGAFISAIFVGMLSNGFTLTGVNTYLVYTIKGILILLSVSLTSFRAGGQRK